MSDQRRNGIAWTDETWNPLRGCSKVSPGCKNCYAETMAARFAGPGQPYEGTIDRGRWNGQIRLVPEKLAEPLRWRRPRRIFVNSMSDIFHESVPFEFVAAVFGVMAACPQHVFQVLTKRPERAAEFFKWASSLHAAEETHIADICEEFSRGAGVCVDPKYGLVEWPLPNVWLGVSVEDQTTADERIPHLLQCPAAVRWVSYEPALGPVDFIGWGPDAPAGPGDDTPERWADFAWPEWVPAEERAHIESFWLEAWGRGPRAWLRDHVHQHVPSTGTRRLWSVDKNGWAKTNKRDAGDVWGRYIHCWNNIGRIITDDGRVLMATGGSGAAWLWRRDDGKRIDWIVIGGESGPHARPFDVAWARSTIAQCQAAGVACFVKQMGARPRVAEASRLAALWAAMPGGRVDDCGGIHLRDRTGADPAEWPEDLRVREWPAAKEGEQ